MTMVRAGLIVLATLAVFVAGVAGVGLMLPRDHVETRSARLPADPDAIFAAIADVGAYAAWRTSLSAVEVLPPVDGRARWVEVSGGDRVAMEQVERQPPRRLVTRIADPDLPFGGTWTFELAPEEGGTRLTITERGEIRNPIFRVVSRFVFGYGATMETFLDELRAHLG
jgi:ribosome-associated toxin RatA of RatAB toxin-antitoxin module